MMVTDDERREVARKLREVNPCRNQSYTVPYNRYTPAAEYLSKLAGALGYSPKNDVSRLEFQNRLADLIEPSKPEGTCGDCRHFIKDRFMPCAAAHGYTEADVSACEDFSPLSCDRDALLALADELDANAELIIRSARNARLTGRRPTMEEAKHDAYEWRHIARRIREALGVEHG